MLAAWLMGFAALACAEPVKDTLEQRLLACAGCHGKRGEGLKANEYYPPIAGKPAGYLFNQLVNFRERRRQVAVMNYLVAFLSDEYLREIAEYYAKLPASPRPPAAPLPSGALKRGETLMLQGDAARKIPACAACHGKAFAGMEPSIPGLLGLDAQYIGAQMGAWRNGVRRAQEPDCMANIASLLAPGDIESIAAYLASLPPSARSAPLPAGSLKPPMECGGV